jgi:hypothetical protein
VGFVDAQKKENEKQIKYILNHSSKSPSSRGILGAFKSK